MSELRKDNKDMWQMRPSKINQTIYNSFYLYNYTTYDQVNKVIFTLIKVLFEGVKPIATEVGPFIYKETTKYKNLSKWGTMKTIPG